MLPSGPWAWRSDVASAAWPPVLGGTAATLMAMQHALSLAECGGADALRAGQRQQRGALLDWMMRRVPVMRSRASGVGLDPDAARWADDATFQRLPVLTRADLQEHGTALDPWERPQGHGDLDEVRSSGSTGRPVAVRRTALTRLWWEALTLREHLWHRRCVSGRLAVLRAVADGVADPPKGKDFGGWGVPLARVMHTGTSHMMSARASIDVVAAWIQRLEPHDLLLYPSALRGLLDHWSTHGGAPQLRSLRTYGEVMPPSLAERAHAQLGVGVSDTYSSQECGVLAFQCPEEGAYHVASAGVELEILRDDGSPCEVGEVGRVVVTTLQNFATALIRYDIGDYASFGPPCACGRPQPVLEQILGRQRNLLTLPDGRQVWPLFADFRFHEVAAVRQWQVARVEEHALELRLVLDAPLSDAQGAALGEILTDRLGWPFEVRCVRVEAIPRGVNGKHEDYVDRRERR